MCCWEIINNLMSKMDEILSLAIPPHTSTISMHTASLVKIHWYLVELSSSNENTGVLGRKLCQK